MLDVSPLSEGEGHLILPYVLKYMTPTAVSVIGRSFILSLMDHSDVSLEGIVFPKSLLGTTTSFRSSPITL